MRLASILLSAIMLSCFSAQAQVNIFGQNTTMPEPLVSGPNMDVPEPFVSKPNMDMPEPLTPKPTMDMPKPNPKPPIVSNTNFNQTINLTGNISSNKTQMIQMQQEVKPLNVSGKWSIKLSDITDSSLDLNLWSSSGSKLMGFGTLTEGSTTFSVTASGSVGAHELTLTTKSAVPDYDREYDLHLFMVNNTLSGTYVLKSGGQSLGKGNATAAKR
ncbi:MAG: hypothetical protein MUO26_04265 [Methanotrichaceae archaeon]|nr:hypothetical protein [Methanotrichaceae archaeon]